MGEAVLFPRMGTIKEAADASGLEAVDMVMERLEALYE